MIMHPTTSLHPAPSLLTSALALALLALPAAAQTVPNIGDALRQSQPNPQTPRPETSLPGIGGQTPIEPPMAALPGAPQVAVKAITVEGNRVIDGATLLSLVADGVGKAQTLPELEALAQRITLYYRTQGYFVARAYVPAQDVTAGTIRFRVVEGNYGRFLLRNSSLVRDAIVQGMLDDVKHYDIVSLDTLERAMLIINDTPGAEVTRADVMPGEKVGTSDFAVDTKATPRYDGFVMLDNYGSAYTGINRLSFNLDVNSPTGGGDRLSLSGLDTNGNGLLNGRIGYSTSLAPNGLRGEVAVSQTEYQLGDVYSPLDAVGTATGIDAGLSYPLRRIRAQTIAADLTLSYKDLVDDIRATGTRTPKTLTSATAGISLRDERSLFGLDGLTQASAALTMGRLDIRSDSAAALDAAGANTQGSYRKLMANLSRVTALSAQWSATAAFRGQYAFGGKTLDGSERMAASGPGAVVAYAPGELIGDDAWLVHADVGRPLPWSAAIRPAGQIFLDYGAASAWTAPGTAASGRRHIADVGVGLTVALGAASARITVAHRFDPAAPLSEPEPRNRLLVQAAWTF